MRLPTVPELELHLRTTLVVNAEVQYLSLGGELGLKVATNIIGHSANLHTIPTDVFAGDEIQAIPIAHLSIYNCILNLRELLEANSLGYGAQSRALDSDFIEQEYLDLLELYLSALPEMTFGAFDWGGCRRGAMRDLLLTGKAWHRLACMVDQGTRGDFGIEQLTATDLALIADIELRSLRNLVGPNKKLRSQEQYQKRKTQVSERGFATINRFDALNWLVQRKGFAFAPLKVGLLASRLRAIDDPISRGRAALIAGLALGHPFNRLAEALEAAELSLRELGDGQGHPELAECLTQFVIQLDERRASDTVPA